MWTQSAIHPGSACCTVSRASHNPQAPTEGLDTLVLLLVYLCDVPAAYLSRVKPAAGSSSGGGQLGDLLQKLGMKR